ncbi:paraquat-inducible protein A [Gayadomonas joobiniege]|uniref:paraquat-inducible protein A n=1 Tax=Gayadomonas joobiniege TaxID=1234606 RepID=UPI000368C68E|nr:paraquat-inducible protein A [Gayadomonas joobiniege]
MPLQNKTAASQGLVMCTLCEKVNQVQLNKCQRCGSHLYQRKPFAIQKTVAWLITAILFYFPANLFPVMETSSFGHSTYSTIVGGVIDLWKHGAYIIATVIFLASVVIPIGKILVLAWLCISLRLKHQSHFKQRTFLYTVTHWIGRWSMVDVFVVAILVALLQLGGLMTVYPGFGTLSFALVVITTMLAAESFDPRLIWDKQS